MPSGVQAGDFLNFVQADWGATISKESVTVTHDPITGKDIRAYGAGANFQGILHIMRESKFFAGVGEIKKGDAYIMTDTAVVQFDKLTLNNDVWLITSPVLDRRLPDGTVMYYFARCEINDA